MADDSFISFSFDTSAFDAMTVAIKDPTRRATMYAIRAVGRSIARDAKSKAPVYKGDDPRAQAESGNLRKSIANARNMKAAGDTFELKVGPFGTKKKGTDVKRHGKSKGQARGVPLYRSKMEAQYGFMASAISTGEATAEAVFNDAYAKAWARWSK